MRILQCVVLLLLHGVPSQAVPSDLNPDDYPLLQTDKSDRDFRWWTNVPKATVPGFPLRGNRGQLPIDSDSDLPISGLSDDYPLILHPGPRFIQGSPSSSDWVLGRSPVIVFQSEDGNTTKTQKNHMSSMLGGHSGLSSQPRQSGKQKSDGSLLLPETIRDTFAPVFLPVSEGESEGRRILPDGNVHSRLPTMDFKAPILHVPLDDKRHMHISDFTNPHTGLNPFLDIPEGTSASTSRTAAVLDLPGVPDIMEPVEEPGGRSRWPLEPSEGDDEVRRQIHFPLQDRPTMTTPLLTSIQQQSKWPEPNLGTWASVEPTKHTMTHQMPRSTDSTVAMSKPDTTVVPTDPFLSQSSTIDHIFIVAGVTATLVFALSLLACCILWQRRRQASRASPKFLEDGTVTMMAAPK